jgi:rhodanese-related sulfurtransferase
VGTTAGDVRRALRDRVEIALLDVRPEARFAAGHPLFAASFPLGRLEAEVYSRLPRRSVPVVVYGEGPGDAAAAARRLGQLGYEQVSLLAGGLDGWAASGGELFTDVNTPSKAFGELVEAAAGTPAVDAGDLRARLDERADIVVLDARRFEEYQVMSIPTATSVPGAELVLRARALAPDPATTVVVNCAGRTRSIIGTQSLINAGLPNQVVALRNGTMGWALAGLTLDHGQRRRPPDIPAPAARRAQAAARSVADRAGARRITPADLAAALDDGGRTVYRFDVRTPEEYAAGHRPGFRPAPGGQLVQETDWFAPVRGAVIVLDGDDGGRAEMTASWLAQMGWAVAVLDAGPGPAETGERTPPRPEPPRVPLASAAQADDWLRAGQARVVDVGPSPRYRAGHLPGAAWALRADLYADLRAGPRAQPGRLVLTSPDGYLAAFAAAEVAEAATGPDGAEVLALDGGTDGWARSGRPLESGPAELLSPEVDVYRRPYEGTAADPAAMRAYLDWEHGLVAQLERDRTHHFRVLTSIGGDAHGKLSATFADGLP